jgi:hypothetical protein
MGRLSACPPLSLCFFVEMSVEMSKALRQPADINLKSKDTQYFSTDLGKVGVPGKPDVSIDAGKTAIYSCRACAVAPSFPFYAVDVFNDHYCSGDFI